MMYDIALNGGAEKPVSLSSVAERTGLSHGYLEQLAISLRAANLVSGVAGRHGGYKLTDAPDRITVRAIMEAMMGPVRVVDCVDESDSCPHADACVCFDVYDALNRSIIEVLEEFTLGELIHRSALKPQGLAGQ